MAVYKKDISIENGRLLKRTPLNIEARLPSYNSLLAFVDNYGTDIGRFVTDYYPNYMFDDEPVFDLVDEPELYDVVYLNNDGKYYKALVDDGAITENVMGVRHTTPEIADIVYSQGFIPMGTSSVMGTLGYLVETVGILTGDPVYLSGTTAGKLTNVETDIKLGYYVGKDSDSNYILNFALDSGYIRPNSYDELTNKIFDGDLNLLKNFKYERSLSFNGTTSMISFTDDSNLNFGTDDFSILLRFRTSNDFSGGAKPIIGKGSGTERYEIVMTTTNTLQFQVQDDGSELTIESDDALNDGVAHTVIILGDRSGNYTMIVDGTLQLDSAVATAITITNSESLYLGRNEGGSDFFTGEIIGVRFFDRLLTDLEAKSWARNPFKESATVDEIFVVTAESFAVDSLNDLTTNGNNSSATTDITVIKPETAVNVIFRDESYIFTDHIGIGLINPNASSRLHIYGDRSIFDFGTSGNSQVRFIDDGTDGWDMYGSQTEFGVSSLQSTITFTLDTSSNAIFSCSAPRFIISDTAAATGQRIIIETQAANYNFGLGIETADELRIGPGSQDADATDDTITAGINISSTGTVGINASPNATLFVYQTASSTWGSAKDISIGSTMGTIGNVCELLLGYYTSTNVAPASIGAITTTETNGTIVDIVFNTRSVDTATTVPSERVRIMGSGDVGVGTNGSINTLSTEGWKSGRIFEIAHTGSSQIPMLSLSSSVNANATMVGSFQFVNTGNLGDAAATGMTIAAMVAKTVTSDANADDDSGGLLEWYTKAENAALTKMMDLDASGNLTVVGDITSNGTNLESHATDLTGAVHGATSGPTDMANMIVRRDASSDIWVNIMNGTATAAEYSDLAEKYTVLGEVIPGMVVSRNFEDGPELKITMDKLGPDVFGIVSTDPAYLMNSKIAGHPITMIGRVPVLIEGPVEKWDLIVPAGNGHGRAMKSEDDSVFVIAESLETNLNNDVKLVECFAKVITKS